MTYNEFMDAAEEWLKGFMECSPLFEYQVSEEEANKVVKRFRAYMDNILDLKMINDGVGDMTYDTAYC